MEIVRRGNNYPPFPLHPIALPEPTQQAGCSRIEYDNLGAARCNLDDHAVIKYLADAPDLDIPVDVDGAIGQERDNEVRHENLPAEKLSGVNWADHYTVTVDPTPAGTPKLTNGYPNA